MMDIRFKSGVGCRVEIKCDSLKDVMAEFAGIIFGVSESIRSTDCDKAAQAFLKFVQVAAADMQEDRTAYFKCTAAIDLDALRDQA